ncbi:PbsX family transcriptional regulator [uncultured Methylobacterium sp.]|jgi:antitoxin ChpS|uniref:AbrB/MazE/SpoVT family DNA-binding domain-containing protein n=1 Tax=uncultured Methylobacterium sp. TaxID=157278 RepID=UPI0026300737|nr:PbsX family transcriptional regulator [uncultured Methylobacterium sp.]
MPTLAKVRKQGGARIITLPSAILSQAGIDVGAALALEVRDGAIVATPVAELAPRSSRRYSLDELLVGAEHLPEIYDSVADALDGDPVGREFD